MGCNCGNIVVVTPKKNCNGCIIVHDLRLGCIDGPDPCSTGNTIDVGSKNDLAAMVGIPEWKIKKYDKKAFENVSIDQDGVIIFDVRAYYKKKKEFKIVYEVNDPESLFRGEGTIHICLKNPCEEGCEECHPCTKDCITVENAETEGFITAEGCPDIQNNFVISNLIETGGCVSEYEFIYPKTVFKNVWYNLGQLSYILLPQAVSEAEYEIQGKLICTEFDITKKFSIKVKALSKCHGVTCPQDFKCDPCTGNCIAIDPEIAVEPINNNLRIR